MTEDAEKQPDDSPWYLLATLYGPPDKTDEELQARNRVAWNRCMASQLGVKLRAYLIEVGRHPVMEVTPFSADELKDVEIAFADRVSGKSCHPAKISDLVSGDIDLSKCEIKYLNAKGMIFPEDAVFTSTTFSEGADFTGATFAKRADFRGATFDGVIDCRETLFSAEGFFKDPVVFTTFDEYLNSGVYSDMADFEEATFNPSSRIRPRKTRYWSGPGSISNWYS